MSAAMSRKKSWLPPASLAESLNSFPSFVPSDVYGNRETTASGGSSTSFASAASNTLGKPVLKVKLSGFRSRVPSPNHRKEAPAQPSLQSTANQLHLPDGNREPLGHCPDGYADRFPSWSFEIGSGAGFNVERSGTAHLSTPNVLALSSSEPVQLSFYKPIGARRGAYVGSSVALVSGGVPSQGARAFRKSSPQHASLPTLEDLSHTARQSKDGEIEKKRKAGVPLRSRALASLRSTKSRGGLVEQLLCGGFAGIISRTAVAPIDLIRVSSIMNSWTAV